MKSTTTISSLLGLTQKQMALLLRVSRSQWSMYESGQRGLPLRARQLLAEMIGFLKFEDKSFRLQQYVMEQEEAKKKHLEHQLKENEYQLYEIVQKVESIETKYHTSLTAIGLVDYLNTLPDTKQKLDDDLLDAIASDARRALKKSGLADLTALSIKKELLELEKLLLGSALNKVAKNLEKIKGGPLSYNY